MEVEEKFAKEQMILDNFFDEYVRPPKAKEFMKIIKSTSNYPMRDYKKFLRAHGYHTYENNIKTLELIDIKDGIEKVIFIGTKEEIANELDIGKANVDYYLRVNKPYLKRYLIREKFIDLDKSYC